jgi:hypothetical protein
MKLRTKILLGVAGYEVLAFVYNMKRPSGQTQAPLDGIGYLYQSVLSGIVGGGTNSNAGGATAPPACTAWQ